MVQRTWRGVGLATQKSGSRTNEQGSLTVHLEVPGSFIFSPVYCDIYMYLSGDKMHNLLGEITHSQFSRRTIYSSLGKNTRSFFERKKPLRGKIEKSVRW